MDSRPNIVLIIADDMNWDAVGAFGCPVPGTTPNIDDLADEGIRFAHAHVTIAVCQPSRSTMMTGRYPHRCGGEGFFHLRRPGIPVLPQLLRAAGYRVGILGKVAHSTPYESFAWDMVHDMAELGQGRNPDVYRGYASAFMSSAADLGKPFFLMANSHDPHRPFYGNDRSEWYQPGEGPAAAVPSRTFKPEAVRTPGFLFDLPEVRLEISEYYSSVRRCDDTVGAVLAELRRRQIEENTLVMFLSDNGMAFPFAKTNCYLHSTRTPWIVRWPAAVRRGSIDCDHFISGIDLAPTILDACGIAVPDGVDGRSFLPLLRGQASEGRELVFTQFHQTAMKGNYPMRCVQSARFGYIWNPWSDGNRVFHNESQSGRTMAAMKAAAATDPAIASRVELFLHRVPEELYDFQSDPDALHNLVGDRSYVEELDTLRGSMARWMARFDDPAESAFLHRDQPETIEDFMVQTSRELGGA